MVSLNHIFKKYLIPFPIKNYKRTYISPWKLLSQWESKFPLEKENMWFFPEITNY
jgi:hypothetical protein